MIGTGKFVVVLCEVVLKKLPCYVNVFQWLRLGMINFYLCLFFLEEINELLKIYVECMKRLCWKMGIIFFHIKQDYNFKVATFLKKVI